MLLNKPEINIRPLLNPFYLFPLAFFTAILLYTLKWSRLYPELSSGLILFFISITVIFLICGYLLSRWKYNEPVNIFEAATRINSIVFYIIILLWVIDVLITGYIPVFGHSNRYNEFGAPVIDVLFNTLCIFFSVVYFRSFLSGRKKKYLVFLSVILILQIFLLRRSAIVWISLSIIFLYILTRKKIKMILIAAVILLIPVLSYCFGFFGSARGNLPASFVMNDLGASDSFKELDISHNHYLTYLYFTSPLANLQQNIKESNTGLFNNCDIRGFIYYSIIPQSLMMRITNKSGLKQPDISLVHPRLIVGTCFLISYITMGWAGMSIMVLFFILYIFFCILLLRRFNNFFDVGYSLLLSASSMMFFDNFLIRLDVIIMLFLYPFIFHIIYKELSGWLLILKNG